MPGSRKGYWEPKLHGNVERDKKHRAALRKLGWRSLVLWECELQNLERIERKVTVFLRGQG